ncbi:MAG: cell division protein FtsW [Lentisphaeria bacterium]|nr:cell division protein FtsW [Lentisphaeria bacterium]
MKARTANIVALALLLLLVGYGLMMLYSISLATGSRGNLADQAKWVCVGITVALALRYLDYQLLGKWSWVALVGVALALAYLAMAFALYKCKGHLPSGFFESLPFVPDHPTKGSFRWLRLPFASAQPSELAKPILGLFLATYYGGLSKEETQTLKKGVLVPGACAAGTLFLVLCGKDLSTAAITGAVVFSLMFVAGVRLRYLSCIALIGVVLFAGLCKTNPERMRRFGTYQDPEACQDNEGYQLWHSQLALGSGGVTGLQFTNSRMKQMYLPEAHTDFIVAIIGEEFGYVGVLGVIVLYCLLCVAIFWTGLCAVDRKGFLICFSVALGLGLQALTNLSVVSGFCPTTGVTAPFLSYGGSSMLACFVGFGLVSSCARVAYKEDLRERERERYRSIPVDDRDEGALGRHAALAIAFGEDDDA